MTKLPAISGTVCVAALKKVGFTVLRQKGSHLILRRETPFSQLVVPEHSQLDRGMLRAIIRQAELSVDEFQALL